jgi:hypothetical protein
VKGTGDIRHVHSVGAKKRWRPTCRRDLKRLFRNREAWREFKEIAQIDKRITYDSARRRAKLDVFTLARWINGLTDCKLSSAMHFCEALDGVDLNLFAAAMRNAWEKANREADIAEALKGGTL